MSEPTYHKRWADPEEIELFADLAPIPPNLYREISIRFFDCITNTLIFIHEHPNRELALQVAGFTFGICAITNGRAGAEIAENLGVTRAAFSKMLKKFQRQLFIGPSPGQKSTRAVRIYRKSRVGKLNKKTP